MIKELKRIMFIFWIALSIFYIVRIVILTRYVGLDKALADTQQQITKLTLDNRLMENEIAKESSLNHLSEEASKAGYTQPEKIWYIK